jgi:hypothetical protein
MNMNAIASTLQLHINTAFMNFLKRKYPDREFSMGTFTTDVMVDEGQDESYEAMAASLEPQTVAGHERINPKTGEVKWIEEYTKQPKSLTAMDIAVSEVNAENGGNTGLDMEAELEAFIDALTSQTITLGQMNSKD